MRGAGNIPRIGNTPSCEVTAKDLTKYNG